MTPTKTGSMSLLEVRDVEVSAGVHVAVEPSRVRPSRAFRVRMAAVIGLTALSYAAMYADVLGEALRGSRTAFLLVVPVLVVMIALGYRTPPRGVGDGEADWIIATLIGSAGFIAIHVVSERLPALSGLWRLPAVGAVLWFACLLTVMFGVRHVARMWALWVFALCSATPLPFLLITAALGGSDTAAVLVASAFGAAAVMLAVRTAPIRARLVGGLGCYLVAAAVGVATGATASLLVSTVLAAGVVPVVTVAILHRTVVEAKTAASKSISLDAPPRSALSMVMLVVLAVVLMLLNPSSTDRAKANPVPPDWIERSSLKAEKTFSFVTRYFGTDSRLDRYLVPAVPGMPAAAVDVVTTTNAAALGDLADAVWYPSSRPVDYRAAEPSDSMPLGARIIHSNADAATNRSDAHWYAVTWVWAAGSVSQRVTVIVSQAVNGDQAPPEPAPLSVLASSVRPALWVARQQPRSIGQVDELVTRRATDVVAQLTAAHE